MGTPTPPPVPTDELEDGGWTLQDERTETFFELPTMRISGTTRQYTDERSSEALLEQTDGNIEWEVRFFAVTRLGFEPPPPPGVSPTMFAPTLRSEVRRSFAEQLERRGLADIERGRRERLRLPGKNRARLTQYTASDRLGDQTVGLECWVGIWTSGREVFVVTGGYPRTELADELDVNTEDPVLTRSTETYRDEFFSLVRGVAGAES